MSSKFQAGDNRLSGLSVERIDAWLREAQPNARLVYFHGSFAGHNSEAANARLQAEAERGMVFLVQDYRTRGPCGHDYVAIRSSRRFGQDGKPEPRGRTLAQDAAATSVDRALRSSWL